MNYLLTFIGFGEASYHIAKGLKSEGLGEICAYDAFWDHPEKGQLIRKRAEEAGIVLIPTMEEAIVSSKYIMSATSAKIAVSIAQSVFPYMRKGQVFVDINAASPMAMKEIDKLLRKEGVLFCDAAVMGVVPTDGHKVPMLLSGDGALSFENEFSKYGMKLTDLNAVAGGSSAIKMFRSIFMKGLTQLMIESLSASAKFGVLDTIVESLSGSIQNKTIVDLANQLLPRTVVHAERRVSEMKEVISTLEDMGMDCSMSISTKEKLIKISSSVESKKLNGIPPKDYKEAIDILLNIL
ncbi:MAG: phosphogluconate dehydrogenase [Clostridia bacterium]|jgi:3-hydroxyisobutyrate dehydrogenase-like beta-hydroxyacid dehydrogenase|nr:phosphogluconate dehydrogenase [Clostridia bacterium]